MNKLFIILISFALIFSGCKSTGVYGNKSGNIKSVEPAKIQKVDSRYGRIVPAVEKGIVIKEDKNIVISTPLKEPVKKSPSTPISKYSNTGADILKNKIEVTKGETKINPTVEQNGFWERVLKYYLYLAGILVSSTLLFYGYKVYKTRNINPFKRKEPEQLKFDI